jgi:hypothetical protein
MAGDVEVPWHTGVPEGVFWGLAAEGAFLAAGVAATVAGASVVGGAFVAGAGIAGIANAIKTVVEKREEYAEAHSHIQSSSVELNGKVAGKSLAREY